MMMTLRRVKQTMLTGVIVAGGQNRRMEGKVKALLPFHGEAVIVRQIREMQKTCDRIVVVARDPRLFSHVADHNVQIIEDRIPGKGPLSGMHAAFSELDRAAAWVVGCDMPFISEEAAQLMWERKQEKGCDAVVPYIAGRIHPLHGIYDKRCLEPATDLLQSGDYRLTDLLDRLQWDTVQEEVFVRKGIDCRFVINMNTPEQYRAALQQQK